MASDRLIVLKGSEIGERENLALPRVALSQAKILTAGHLWERSPEPQRNFSITRPAMMTLSEINR
jgi:hypothetical protein